MLPHILHPSELSQLPVSNVQLPSSICYPSFERDRQRSSRTMPEHAGSGVRTSSFSAFKKRKEPSVSPSRPAKIQRRSPPKFVETNTINLISDDEDEPPPRCGSTKPPSQSLQALSTGNAFRAPVNLEGPPRPYNKSQSQNVIEIKDVPSYPQAYGPDQHFEIKVDARPIVLGEPAKDEGYGSFRTDIPSEEDLSKVDDSSLQAFLSSALDGDREISSSFKKNG